jgi:hypothetical protein
MDCAKFSNFLRAYHLGGASLRETPEAGSHLRSCAACRGTLQTILRDVDVAAFEAFFREVDPPKDFADGVIGILPGEKGKETEPEGPAPGRDDRRDRGKTAGAFPARAAPARHGSGPGREFLVAPDGMAERSRGAAVTYCKTCGCRIDAIGLDPGSTASFLCAACVPETRDGRHRKPAEERTASSRPAPAFPSARPKRSLPGMLSGALRCRKAGAAIVALAVLLPAVALLVARARRDPALPSPDSERGSSSPIEVLLQAERNHDKALAEIEKEKERRREVPGRMILAKARECRELEEKNDFPASLARWNEFLDRARAGECMDEKGLGALFLEEHFSEIGTEISEVGRRWERSVAEEGTKIIDRSGALCSEARSLAENMMGTEMKAKFEEARKVLQEYPKEWEGRFADTVQRLVQAKNDIDYLELQTEKTILAIQQKKARRTVETGRWVEILQGEIDFQANWDSKIDRRTWEEDGKSMTVEGRSDSFLTHRFGKEAPGSASWLDYEIEFEVKSNVPLSILLRHRRNADAIRVPIPATARLEKYSIKVEGVALYVVVNGERKAQGIVDLQSGPPVFLVSGSRGSFTLREVKVKVNKTSN